MLRHGSLFSGIGGFDLAATWMGWKNIFNCEKDEFCRKLLHYYWPEVMSYENIFQFNANQYRGQVDIISGGFPCQPFSAAGRRKGETDDRYLWPETRRVIIEARPRYIVLENVAGLFTILEQASLSEMEVQAIELFCSDSEQQQNKTIIRLQRRVIGRIIEEIESAGYLLPRLGDGTPVVLCVPACAKNAPHRRDRIWFVAHSQYDSDCQDSNRYGESADYRTADEEWQGKAAVDKGRADHDGQRKRFDTKSKGSRHEPFNGQHEIFTTETGMFSRHDIKQADGIITDTNSKGLEGGHQTGNGNAAWRYQIPGWDEWPTQPAVCGRNDGISFGLDGITFSKWRQESIRAYGNAIVPQIALELFRAIEIEIKQQNTNI